MHSRKLLLAKPHVAQPTKVINLKSHESTAVSLESTFMCSKVRMRRFRQGAHLVPRPPAGNARAPRLG